MTERGQAWARLRLVVATGAMVALGALHGVAQAPLEIPFPPVDEASKDAGFVAFRQRLFDVVERRDLQNFLSATSPTVMYSFSEAPGVEGFRRHYQLDDEKSEFWTDFLQVLSLGGSFRREDIFVAPYVYSKWPAQFPAEADYVAIVGRDVRVYAEPQLDTPVLHRIESVIVKTEYDDRLVGRWHRVVLADGRRGYVPHNDARRPVDLRAFFSRTAAGWQMVICITGD
jgi:hypothetical protein